MRLANGEMVRALRVVTVNRGVDPRDLALLPFGGAGPMHAADLADEMGMSRILCPRSGDVLSASLHRRGGAAPLAIVRAGGRGRAEPRSRGSRAGLCRGARAPLRV